MNHRRSIPSILALFLILAQSLAPFAHFAWGHQDACAHSACAVKSTGISDLRAAPDTCDVCAWIGKLQPPSTALPALRQLSQHAMERVPGARCATHAAAPDLTAGGARAPPR